MLRGLRRLRPSPALVVASMALLVSLGGVGYAATKLPRNSVGTAQLRNNAINSAKVRNHSLKSADFARGVVRQGAQGATGPQGPAGPQGATGARGASGVGIGGSCDSGAAISGVTSAGSLSCQPPASDSAAGYLTAADHAAFGAARTLTFSNSTLAGTSYGSANEIVAAGGTITVPNNLHKLFALWNGEWKGGTSTAPSTMDCSITLDGSSSILPGATGRRSTSTGGYVDIVVSTLLDVTPGQHKVWVNCGNDTAGASIGNASLTLIATE